MISEILGKSFEAQSNFEELLKNKLKATGLSKTRFERLSGIQRKSLDAILKKSSKQTNVVNLLKLGEFLELSLEELLILHFKDRPTDEIKALQDAMDITYINKNFDLKTLVTLGFIKTDDPVAGLSNRICKFFELDSIYSYERELNGALYSRTKRPFSDKMKDFWVKSSYKYFELIDNPNEYSRGRLLDLMPKIKPYTQNVEKGLLTIFQALFNVGVTVVFQPSLPKTQIRGATFFINNKPCVVITDLNKNYATIWFALIHELNHVLFDLDTIEDIKFHLSGAPDLFLLQEDRANEFASEYLFSSEKMRYIEQLINNPLLVRRFAKQCQVHPCIIYSQYQWRQYKSGNNYWGYFKEHFPDVALATKNLNISNWDVQSLRAAAEKIRTLLTV